MNWTQDFNLRKRAMIRRQMMCRMHESASNMTLVIVGARLLSMLDGEPSEDSFKRHLQFLCDWSIEIEYSARLARRARRIKQPGTVARQLTESAGQPAHGVKATPSQSEAKAPANDDDLDFAWAVWAPWRQRILERGRKRVYEATRGLGEVGKN